MYRRVSLTSRWAKLRSTVNSSLAKGNDKVSLDRLWGQEQGSVHFHELGRVLSQGGVLEENTEGADSKPCHTCYMLALALEAQNCASLEISASSGGSNRWPAGCICPGWLWMQPKAQWKTEILFKPLWDFFMITCHNVFNVSPKTTLLPVWPRDANRLDSPGRSFCSWLSDPMGTIL